jgi:hypothetical protein
MRRKRPALFRGRHFADEIIVLCVRWYLRYSLSYRDLAEMMRERNLSNRLLYDLEMRAAVCSRIECASPPRAKTDERFVAN